MGIPLASKVSNDTDRGREGGIFIPDGKYLVRVNLMEEREKKGDEGKTYLHAEYEILDSLGEEGVNAIGLRIFDNLSLTEAALWRIVKICDVCLASFGGEKKAFTKDGERNEIPDLDGKEFVVKTANEKYNNRDQVNVKDVEDRFNWEGQTLKTNDAGEHIVESGGNAKAGADSKQVSV
jgi:hypothetical protein